MSTYTDAVYIIFELGTRQLAAVYIISELGTRQQYYTDAMYVSVHLRDMIRNHMDTFSESWIVGKL